jgi:hypothetical protein
MEVSRANSSLGVAKEKQEYKKATVGRSYAEVVMEAQAGGSEEYEWQGQQTSAEDCRWTKD